MPSRPSLPSFFDPSPGGKFTGLVHFMNGEERFALGKFAYAFLQLKLFIVDAGNPRYWSPVSASLRTGTWIRTSGHSRRPSYAPETDGGRTVLSPPLIFPLHVHKFSRALHSVAIPSARTTNQRPTDRSVPPPQPGVGFQNEPHRIPRLTEPSRAGQLGSHRPSFSKAARKSTHSENRLCVNRWTAPTRCKSATTFGQVHALCRRKPKKESFLQSSSGPTTGVCLTGAAATYLLQCVE